jgi:hypothetical protein
MTAHDHLQVHVNDELVLDAGTCVQVSGPNGPELLISPPEATLFHQVLAYLRAKSNPPVRLSGSMAGREGVAAAAVVLRWGSYLALLLASPPVARKLRLTVWRGNGCDRGEGRRGRGGGG